MYQDGTGTNLVHFLNNFSETLHRQFLNSHGGATDALKNQPTKFDYHSYNGWPWHKNTCHLNMK